MAGHSVLPGSRRRSKSAEVPGTSRFGVSTGQPVGGDKSPFLRRTPTPQAEELVQVLVLT